jgi:serine-type D-Ala-D-Ala carboxypeptidase (penicillin-binding protein 5/6)
MTAYLSLRDLPLSRRLTAPPYSPIPGESLLGLEPGERDSVRDLLYGLLLPSGNDAAVTLAQGDAGSVPAFVAKMNRAAARLGLTETHYATPVGLDSPGNYSTAHDLVELVEALRRDPRFRRITDTRHATLRDGAEVRHVTNHNDLVLSVPWVNGVKTGYTKDAGYVLVASGTMHGVTLISAVLDTPSIAARDEGSLELLRYGFSQYRPRTALSPHRSVAQVPVKFSRSRLALRPASGARFWMRAGQRVRVRTRTPHRVTGPIRRGQRLGSATATAPGGRRRTVALRAARAVPTPTSPAAVERALPGTPDRQLAGIAATIATILALAGGVSLVTLPFRRPRLR